MKHTTIQLMLAVALCAALAGQTQTDIKDKPATTGGAMNAANDSIIVFDASDAAAGNPALKRLPFAEAANVSGFFSAVPNGTFTLSKLAQSGATSGQAAVWNGSAWAPATVATSSAWGGITGTLSAQTDLNSALGTKVDLTALSQTGGINKVLQTDGSGNLALGPLTGGNISATEEGNLRFPVGRQIQLYQQDGTLGAYSYLMDGHSGGDEWFSYSPRFCFYFNQGFQIGQPYGVTAREPRFMYFNPLGTANSGDPYRESISLNFNSNWWNGSTAVQNYGGIQWKTTSANDGELQFWTGMTSQPNSDGKLASTSGANNSLILKNSGPVLPSGKLITFADGSTLASAPNLQARVGNASLIAGTKTVATTSVTAYTVINLTRRIAGGTTGDLSYTKNPGVGFTINSSSASDTSMVSWLLNEGTLADGSPVISGTSEIGDTLTVTSGGGSGTFQWYSNGTLVSGQTAATYAVRHQDIGLAITCREDGTPSNAITAWHPDDESGYFADFRADAGTLQTVGGAAATANSDPVGEWRDQSGNNRHISQATSGRRPLLNTSTFPGFPHLDFDDTDDELRTLLTLTRPYSAFVVGEYKSVVSNKRIFASSDSGARMYIDQASTTQLRNAGAVSPSASFPINERHIIGARTTATQNAIRIDGGSEVVATETTGNGAGLFVSQSATNSGSSTRVYAVLVYQSDLDTAGQARVRKYLKAKWGTP